MATEKVELFELDINYDDIVKGNAELIKQINKLKKEQKDLLERTNNLTKATDEQSQAYVQNNTVLKGLEKQYKSNDKVLQALNDTQIENIDTVEDARKALSATGTLWAKTTKLEGENSEGSKKLAARKLELTERLKELESATGDNTRNVGNYTESIKDAIGDTGLLGKLTDSLPSSFKGAGDGVKGLRLQFVKLLANPIVLVIAAIVAAVVALGKAFLSNEKNADKFNKVLLQIQSVVDVLLGRLQKLANAALKVFKGDLKGAAEDAKDAVSGVGDEIRQTVIAVGELADAQIKLEEATNNTISALSTYNELAQEQARIADDATRSFAEREAANKKATQTAQAALIIELSLSKQLLSNIEENNNLLEQQGKLTRENIKEREDAAAKVIELEGRISAAEFETEKRRRELRQDRLERDLDISLENFENVKKANEAILSSDTNTFEVRRKALETITTANTTAFNSQIATIQKFTKANVDAQSLVNETDEKALQEKIRRLGLSEIIEGRLIEVIKERRTALTESAQAEAEINAQILDAQLDNLDKELEFFKLSNQSKLDSTKLLTEESVNEEINRLEQISKKEIEFQKELLENKRITQQEYDNFVLSQQNETEKASQELRTQFYDQNKAIEQERLVTDQENKLALAQGNLFAELALQKEFLDSKYKAEIEAAEKIGADTTLIEQKYAKQKREIDKITIDSKLGLAADFANNIATILGKESKAGKAAAAAAATISALQGANAAFASLAPIPIVGVGLGIAAAGAALASGYANVRKIYATKSGLAGEGSGGSAPSGGNSFSGSSNGGGFAPQFTDGGLVGRDLGDQTKESVKQAFIEANQEAPPNQIVVVDDITAAQESQRSVRVAGEI
jgi:hypothetical protein